MSTASRSSTIIASEGSWGQVAPRPPINNENFPSLGSTLKERNKQKWQAFAAGSDDTANNDYERSASSTAAAADHGSRSISVTPSVGESEATGSPREFDLIDWDDEDRPTNAYGVSGTATSHLSHWKHAAKHRSAARAFGDSGSNTPVNSTPSPSKVVSEELLEAFDVADDEIVGYPVLGLAIAQAEGESDTVGAHVEGLNEEEDEDVTEEL